MTAFKKFSYYERSCASAIRHFGRPQYGVVLSQSRLPCTHKGEQYYPKDAPKYGGISHERNKRRTTSCHTLRTALGPGPSQGLVARDKKEIKDTDLEPFLDKDVARVVPEMAS